MTQEQATKHESGQGKPEASFSYGQFSNMGGYRRVDIVFKMNADVENVVTQGETLVNGIFGRYVITPRDPSRPAVVVLREHYSIAKGDWGSEDGDEMFCYTYHPDKGWY